MTDRSQLSHKRAGAEQPGYEPRDVNPRLLAYSAIAVLALLVILLGGIALAFGLREGALPSTRVAEFFALPLADQSQARLQASPEDDLQRMRAVSGAGLDRYGWVDRPAGVVHIPIEKAMALYIQRSRGVDETRETNNGERAGNERADNERAGNE